MKLVIDGYNLLFKMYKHSDFLEGKEKLITMLKKFQSKKDDLELLLFFDGKETENKMIVDNNLKIIYTRDKKTADIEIIKLLNEDPSNYIIVSSDKMVFSKATNKGSVVLFSEEFVGILKSVLNGEKFKYFFRNKKNESKREKIIKWLIK